MLTVGLAGDASAWFEKFPMNRVLHGPKNTQHLLFSMLVWSRDDSSVSSVFSPDDFSENTIVIDPRFITGNKFAQQITSSMFGEELKTSVMTIFFVCGSETMRDPFGFFRFTTSFFQPTPGGSCIAKSL